VLYTLVHQVEYFKAEETLMDIMSNQINQGNKMNSPFSSELPDKILVYQNDKGEGKYIVDSENTGIPAQLNGIRIERLVEAFKSPFQHISVYESTYHGNLLVLDGFIQVTGADYFCYHEMIVHVPMAVIPPTPQTALVIGGGDGAAVNELCKYSCLKKIVWIDIDADVVRLCRKHFPQFFEYHDTRVEYIAMNGADIDFRNEFDIIVVDGADFNDYGADLASQRFMGKLNLALKDEGVITMLGWWAWPYREEHLQIKKLAQAHFQYTHYYWHVDPTMPFGYMGIFLMTDSALAPNIPEHYHRVPEKLLRYYNAELHSASFVLPTCFTKEEGFIHG